MTVLWEQQTGEVHYSVRCSGGSIRLYTNRVFHSQWNPKLPFAGGIWDCLSLPALYRPANAIKRILLLGVGGGAVIRQLRSIENYPCITAVEIDSQHLDIARRWFDVEGEGVALVRDDAIEWVYRYDGAPFDLIIDDLFGHEEGEPVRACPLEIPWLEQLRSRLTPEGLLVANCIDSGQLLNAIPAVGEAGFRYGYRWHLPTYENVIGVFSEAPIHARLWSRHLECSSLDAKSQRQARLIIRRPVRGLDMYRD